MIARQGSRAALLAVAVVLCLATPVRAQVRIPGLAPADPIFDTEVVGKHVWVVGSPGLLLHSADGGVTFAPQGSIGTAALFTVDFVDEKTGWVSGRSGLVMATTDGGATWTKQATGTNEPLLALDFVDARHGMAVGNFAAAVRTDDGGATWKPMRVAPEGEDPTLNGVAMLSATEAVVVAEFGAVYRTADGGASWEFLDVGLTESLFGVTALPGGQVLAVGTEGAMVLSEDGGKTFTAVASGTRLHLFRVAAGAGRVFVTGNAGLVLSADTPKGPYTAWTAPTVFWLGGVSVGADGLGFLVGARSLVLTTADGGRTWKRWGER